MRENVITTLRIIISNWRIGWWSTIVSYIIDQNLSKSHDRNSTFSENPIPVNVTGNFFQISLGIQTYI